MNKKHNNRGLVLHSYFKNWELYLMILVPVIYLIIFKYVPMYGVQIAFKEYIVSKGIGDSPWVGMKYFNMFIQSSEFGRLIGNTLLLNLYNLAANFPFPIILAFGIHYLTNEKMKKNVQLVTYAPYFISTVVMVGMIMQFLDFRTGVVNNIIKMMGGNAINFLGEPAYYKSVYVWTNVWQQTGYGSIIYLATLSSIDPTLHEAAIIDGANKWQRLWNIDIPGILPTTVILLIMNMGYLLDSGFEKALLMQNPLNLRTSEVIDTFVYKVGLSGGMANFSYATAIGLFKSIIGLILVVGVNNLSKKMGQTSLW